MKLLISKIKKALKSTHPVESVQEVIDEFEEVERLIKWREKILIAGNDLEKHRNELDKIADLIVKYGFHDSHVDSCETFLRKYMKQFKQKK